MADDDEGRQLRKRLERERKIRREAEGIAERVVRELYDKQRDLVLLGDISTAANEAKSVEQALQLAVGRVCEYTGWPVGHVHLTSPDGATMLPTTIWHVGDS